MQGQQAFHPGASPQPGAARGGFPLRLEPVFQWAAPVKLPESPLVTAPRSTFRRFHPNRATGRWADLLGHGSRPDRGVDFAVRTAVRWSRSTAVARGTTDVTPAATDPGGLTATQVFQVRGAQPRPGTVAQVPFRARRFRSGAWSVWTCPRLPRSRWRLAHLRSGVLRPRDGQAWQSGPRHTVTPYRAWHEGSDDSTVGRPCSSSSDQGGLTATQVFQVVPNRAPVRPARQDRRKCHSGGRHDGPGSGRPEPANGFGHFVKLQSRWRLAPFRRRFRGAGRARRSGRWRV